MKKSFSSALVALALTAGCDSNPNQQVARQQDPCDVSANPLECYQWRDAGGSVQDYMAGAMAGYMVSSIMHDGYMRNVIVPRPGYYGGYQLSQPLRSYEWQRDNYQRDTIRQQQRQIDRLRAQRDEARRQRISPVDTPVTTASTPVRPAPRAANDNYASRPAAPVSLPSSRSMGLATDRAQAADPVRPAVKVALPSSRSMGLATGGSSSRSTGGGSYRSTSSYSSPTRSSSVTMPSSRSMGLASGSGSSYRSSPSYSSRSSSSSSSSSSTRR